MVLAGMVKLVDAEDSKSSGATRAGSIPALGTLYKQADCTKCGLPVLHLRPFFHEIARDFQVPPYYNYSGNFSQYRAASLSPLRQENTLFSNYSCAGKCCTNSA